MKYLIQLILAIFSLLLFESCTESTSLIPDDDLVVVWGFVHAGKPITEIKLTGTLPLDADSSSIFPPINNATVIVSVNETQYVCDASLETDGYYQYLDTNLNIEPGDSIHLWIEWEDQIIQSESFVPEPPTGLNPNSNTFEIPDFEDRESFMEWRESENRDININWESESDNEWFYVTLESTENNPTPIDMGAKLEHLRTKMIFPPIQGSSFMLRLPMLEFLGWHEVRVYSVNQEYVDLYESREQDSRDLNEPLSNIEGGLGIFSAFNSVAVNLNIVQN